MDTTECRVSAEYNNLETEMSTPAAATVVAAPAPAADDAPVAKPPSRKLQKQGEEEEEDDDDEGMEDDEEDEEEEELKTPRTPGRESPVRDATDDQDSIIRVPATMKELCDAAGNELVPRDMDTLLACARPGFVSSATADQIAEGLEALSCLFRGLPDSYAKMVSPGFFTTASLFGASSLSESRLSKRKRGEDDEEDEDDEEGGDDDGNGGKKAGGRGNAETRTIQEWASLAYAMVKRRMKKIEKQLEKGSDDTDDEDSSKEKSQLLNECENWKQLRPYLRDVINWDHKVHKSKYGLKRKLKLEKKVIIRAFNNVLRQMLKKKGIVLFKVESLNKVLMSKPARDKFCAKHPRFMAKD